MAVADCACGMGLFWGEGRGFLESVGGGNEGGKPLYALGRSED